MNENIIKNDFKWIKYPNVKNKRYKINSDGVIYDVKKERYIPCYINNGGYPSVALLVKRNGIERHSAILVHRLVATAFIPNENNYPMVNHIDGNKQNSSMSNLEWCNARHNNIHAIKTGLRPTGEKCSYSTHTEKEVRQICELLQEGYSIKEVTEKMNIDRSVVHNIKAGSIWKEISKDYNVRANVIQQIDESKARSICEYLELGFTNKEIRTLLGVTKYQILNIRNGSTWTDISSEYNFPRERPVMNKEMAIKVCELLTAGLNCVEISKQLNIGYHAVHKIRSRKSHLDIVKDYKW